ncbi:MAG: metal ABC transporter permease [Gammaproteobacteria bacterium]|nr:metal ABC transporter permease [Gammaproteobacteria bacterium]
MILLPALALSVLMIITHTYLGLHVLARGVIFVDLALAQVAALGASLAFLLGHDAHGSAALAYAFGAALLAAVGCACLRKIADITTREVIIGCVYVVASALSILILSRSSVGMEELKTLLNGNILWVRWQEVGVIGAVYSLLVAAQILLRKRSAVLAFGKVAPGILPPATLAHPCASQGSFGRELLFFMAFAVVITLAVQIAGVLLVFALLIIPAFSATLLAATPALRLALGYLLGLMGSVVGLWLSYAADLPTGTTMVAVLGLLPLLALALRPLAGLVKARRANLLS